MKFPFFASFLVFCAWLAYERYKYTKMDKKIEDSYWNKEDKANAVRRQNLSDLPFLQIPASILELCGNPNDERDEEEQKACILLHSLSMLSIVNLSGMTNTDLKLAYGPANLPKLTEYDKNYTNLIVNLQTLAQKSYDRLDYAEAQQYLEYAIKIGSDISASYYLLANIYLAVNQPYRIDELLEKADQLTTLLKNPIRTKLQALRNSTGENLVH